MTIPVVKETYHTQCVCSCATDGDTKYLKVREDMTIPVVKETSYTMYHVRVQQMVIPNT